MVSTLAELLDALPPEDEDLAALEADPRFAELVEQLSNRPVPLGALRRLWILSGLPVQIAFAYSAHWIRGWFRGAGEQQRQLLETQLRVGLKLLRTMGYMRGAVMKAGQTIANFRDIAPAQIVEVLEKLHFEAPPMHFALLREQVCNELGGEPEEVFESFEPEAFAAASLGQVHRARLKTGEEVAVKIQYPGISRTIRADVRNLLALMTPLRVTRDWENGKEQLEELARALETETDYEQEARTLEKARSLFHEDDGVIVPHVYADYSTRRVLTMEFVKGMHIHEFLAGRPSQELRNHFGEKMMLAWYRMLFSGRMNYIDWHPGNFLFREDGRLGLIDFGYVQCMNDADWDMVRRADFAMQTADRADIVDFMKTWCIIEKEEADAQRLQLAVEYAENSWRPRLAEGPYDFGDVEPLRRSARMFGEFTRKRYTRCRSSGPIITRQDLSYRAMLYRLGARIDIHPIRDREVKVTGWAHLTDLQS